MMTAEHALGELGLCIKCCNPEVHMPPLTGMHIPEFIFEGWQNYGSTQLNMFGKVTKPNLDMNSGNLVTGLQSSSQAAHTA